MCKKEFMLANAKINSIDERGWYIVAGGINGGVDYLYSDGVIREGVKSSKAESMGAFAFWPTKEIAESFYDQWKAGDDDFWDGLGMT